MRMQEVRVAQQIHQTIKLFKCFSGIMLIIKSINTMYECVNFNISFDIQSI